MIGIDERPISPPRTRPQVDKLAPEGAGARKGAHRTFSLNSTGQSREFRREGGQNGDWCDAKVTPAVSRRILDADKIYREVGSIDFVKGSGGATEITDIRLDHKPNFDRAFWDRARRSKQRNAEDQQRHLRS